MAEPVGLQCFPNSLCSCWAQRFINTNLDIIGLAIDELHPGTVYADAEARQRLAAGNRIGGVKANVAFSGLAGAGL